MFRCFLVFCGPFCLFPTSHNSHTHTHTHTLFVEKQLPRFFLAGLLIYAGLPFTELVIVAYQRVTKKEFFTIWLIILINAITGLKNVTGSLATHSLLIAVCSGFVLSAAGFIYQYARITVIRDVVSGQDFQSAVVRPYAEQRLVERLGKRYMVIELEGYIFFGSVSCCVVAMSLSFWFIFLFFCLKQNITWLADS